MNNDFQKHPEHTRQRENWKLLEIWKDKETWPLREMWDKTFLEKLVKFE